MDFEAEVEGSADRRRELIFVVDLLQDGERYSRCVTPFAPNKHLGLVDPNLVVEVRKEGKLVSFEVSARSLARFVELKLDGVDVIFSDNYFDVPAGRKVTATCAIPVGWTLAKVKKALRVQTLYNSFA